VDELFLEVPLSEVASSEEEGVVVDSSRALMEEVDSSMVHLDLWNWN
jgi:hypothetical protein